MRCVRLVLTTIFWRLKQESSPTPKLSAFNKLQAGAASGAKLVARLDYEAPFGSMSGNLGLG